MSLENHKAIILRSYMGRDFADNIYSHLMEKDPSLFDLGDIDIKFHPNKEPYIKIEANIARKRVYVVHAFCGYKRELGSPSENCDPNVGTMTIFNINDAAARASAGAIINVFGDTPWQRADRKDEGRVPIGAAVFWTLLGASGGNQFERVITLELHSGQQQGFVKYPIDNLYANEVFADHFRTLNEDYVIASPDPGGVKRARDLAKRLGKEKIIYCDKIKKGSEKEKVILTGEIDAKSAIIPDDRIDSGTSVVLTGNALRERGVEHVYACAAQAIFSPKDGVTAEQRLKDAGIKVVVGDTIPMSNEYIRQNSDLLTVLSFVPLFGDAIYERETKGSVSRLFANNV